MVEQSTDAIEPAGPGDKQANWFRRLLSQEGGVSKFDRWIEFISAVVLALATIATAWCGYQASLWGGEQSSHMAESNRANVRAAQLSNEALQIGSLHANLFVAWAGAYSENNTQLSDFLFQRFPPVLKTAVEAWIATKPLQNPDAPATPFVMAEYDLPQRTEAAQWEQKVAEEAKLADAANEVSDHYVFLTVVFASVLFFGGISGKFQSQLIDLVMLVLAVVVFLFGVGTLLTFPMQ
jgi:hypothetical protein